MCSCFQMFDYDSDVTHSFFFGFRDANKVTMMGSNDSKVWDTLYDTVFA